MILITITMLFAGHQKLSAFDWTGLDHLCDIAAIHPNTNKDTGALASLAA